jgi:hypothetical protein
MLIAFGSGTCVKSVGDAALDAHKWPDPSSR